MILAEKTKRNIYVNQQDFVSDTQLLIKHSFLLSFFHELLIIITIIYNKLNGKKTVKKRQCYKQL